MNENIKKKYELLKPEIEENCIKYSLSRRLVFSVILTESSGNEWAYRYEEGYPWLVTPNQIARKIGCSNDSMVAMQSSSWGLMQVMGANYYQLGGTGYATEMIRPSLGIEYGCKMLKKFALKYKEPKDIYAAYNAGSVIKSSDGQYRNQLNVNHFFQNYQACDFLE
jgi:hypothetical protein